MTNTVASLQVEIAAELSQLRRGMTEADNLVGNFGRRVASIGDQMRAAGAKVQQLTAPLQAFLGGGVSTVANFEDVMAEIQARTGLSAESMKRMSEYALEMGANTAFSGQQAAEGLLQLLTSGASATEAMEMLNPVLDAAAASGEDLGRTADTVTDIMAAFGLNAEDARMVVDALARASGASSATMSDLGQGFSNVGGQASAMGLSVEDTAAILAIFSENGIKGAEAGTQLRSMLTGMTADTKSTQSAWERLGTSMYDAQGKARPLEDVIEDIRAGLSNMTEEEQNQTIQDLAGSFGSLGLRALLGSISIDAMRDKMEKSASASDVAGARMNTLSGLFDSLKGSIDTLMIEAVGPLLNDFLKPLTEKAIEVVNAIRDWAKENPELAGTIAAVAGAAVILGPALMTVGLALSGISAVAGVVAAGFGAISLPVVALAGGIGLLVAILNNPDIQNGLKAFGDALGMLPQVIEVIAGRISAAINNIGVTIRSGLRDARQFLLEESGKLASAGELVGIDVGARGLAEQLAGSLQAERFEQDISGYLSGQRLEIVPKDVQFVIGSDNVQWLTASGMELPQSFIDSFTQDFINPASLNDAIGKAIGEQDAEALGALVPLKLALAGGPDGARAEMQTLLNQALMAGGDDSAAFESLLPIAAELDVDLDAVMDQYQAMLDQAAAGRSYTTTIYTDFNVLPGQVNLPGAIGGAVAENVPGLATGGFIRREGLAYLHAGETVVPAGAPAGGGNIVNINGVQDVDALLFELRRRGIDLRSN